MHTDILYKSLLTGTGLNSRQEANNHGLRSADGCAGAMAFVCGLLSAHDRNCSAGTDSDKLLEPAEKFIHGPFLLVYIYNRAISVFMLLASCGKMSKWLLV